MVAGACEGGVDIGHSHLDQMGDSIGAGRDLFVMDVGDDNRSIRPDAELGAMGVSDADSLLEAERRFEPRHRGTNVGIDEHRRHGYRWGGAIGQHHPHTTPASPDVHGLSLSENSHGRLPARDRLQFGAERLGLESQDRLGMGLPSRPATRIGTRDRQ